MAITAKFEADFSQFESATQSASGKLRAFEGDAAKVGTAIKSTGDTAALSFGNMKSMATSLAGAFGIAFSVQAVASFGKELLKMGDEIVRVHDRTGLTIKEVQQLSYVAAQSGNTIDELTGAIGQLQNRLASGDKSAVQAVKELGINFRTLIAASPAEQMGLIATAIAKIPDPATRTAIAMDLFGRAGAAILPTLTANFEKLAREAPAASDKTIIALDRAGDALGRFGRAIKVISAESLVGVLDGLEKFAFWAAGMHPPIAAFNVDAAMMSEKQDRLADTTHKTTAELEAEAVAMRKAADETARLLNAQKAYEAQVATLSDKLFGKDNIKRAQEYLDAIGAIENVSHLDADAQQELADALWKGEQAMIAQGLAGDELTGTFDKYRMAATAAGREGAAALKLITDEEARIAANTDAIAQSMVMMGAATDGALRFYQNQFSIGGINHPGARALGGSVSAGSPYLVGERGPELFIPSSSGSISPNGGTVVNAHFYVNGTGQDVARIAVAELTKLMKQGGRKWPAA